MFRFEVRSGDQRQADIDAGRTYERAELEGQDINFDQDYWLNYTFWIEQGSPIATDWMMLGQFHASPDPGDLATNPNWQLITLDGEDEVAIRTFDSPDDPILSHSTAKVRYKRGPLEQGKRYDVVARLKFHATAGEMEAWINGVKVVEAIGVPMSYVDEDGPYFKFGVYRQATPETVIVYYANVKLGTTSLAHLVDDPLPVPYFTVPYPDDATAPVEAEATSLIARMSSPPNDFQALTIHNFWNYAKGSTFLSKLDYLWILAAHEAGAARLNWIADAVNLTATGGPTFTINKGYQGNGTNQDLATGIALTSLTQGSQNNFHIGIWSLTDVNNAGGNSSDIGTDRAYIARAAGSSNAVIRPVTSSAVSYSGGLSYPGHLALVRTASNAWQGFKNGNQVTSGTDASAAFNATLFYLLRSGGVGRGTNQIAAAHVGAALTADEMGELNEALTRYFYSRNTLY